jgi:asparagine synthase (glutamine-hydrolysing)
LRRSAAEARSATTTNAGFVLDVDLATFAVRGTPQPVLLRGCAVALAGHFARTSASGAQLDALSRLLAAYEADGELLSRNLLGQYAAVVVDTRARRVLLVQDSLGVRTLYHFVAGGRLVAASSLVAAVAEHPSAHVDEAYFAAYLAAGAVPFHATPFRELARLSGGTTLVFDGARRTALRPWSPPLRRPARVSDPAARLRALLDEAVASTLPAGGNVFCELSGGLDSSSVFVTAQRLQPPVQPITLVSGSGRYDADDEACAAHVAQAAGVAWHRLDMDRFAPYSVVPDTFVGEPGGETLLAIQAAYRAVLEANDAAVVLTGVPGDPLFGYGGLSPFHLADPLLRGQPGCAIASAREWAASAGGTRPWTHYLYVYGIKPALLYARRRNLVAYQAGALPRWLSRGLLRRHGLDRGLPAQAAPRVGSAGLQFLWESIYLLANTGAVSGFRIDLAAQTRHPLFHRPLVEFMLGLDPALRAQGLRDRILQRDALRDRLPELVRARTTKGGDQRITQEALAGGYWTRVHLRESRLVARGWVDAAGWKRQLERARFGQFDGLGNFHAALAAEHWLRTWEANRNGARAPLRPAVGGPE